VGTAALGCPRSEAPQRFFGPKLDGGQILSRPILTEWTTPACGRRNCRASLGWTAGGGCPHV